MLNPCRNWSFSERTTCRRSLRDCACSIRISRVSCATGIASKVCNDSVSRNRRTQSNFCYGPESNTLTRRLARPAKRALTCYIESRNVRCPPSGLFNMQRFRILVSFRRINPFAAAPTGLHFSQSSLHIITARRRTIKKRRSNRCARASAGIESRVGRSSIPPTPLPSSNHATGRLWNRVIFLTQVIE